MTRFKSWALTDVTSDVWLDSFAVSNSRLRLPTTHDWSVNKRTLRGGLRDGIDLIEVHNGALSFSVLPTRGMGLWRGDYHGHPLGWKSPVLGPVHPKFVDEDDRNGLGWLDGFDEWLVRCGLANNGPPGTDEYTDAHGKTHKAPLTLHGRIANRPAHLVEVRISLDPPYELTVTGEVDEAALFVSPALRLTATYTTTPGSNRLVIHDVVENRSSQPAEVQMLYHCNVGPPFLEAGSRLLLPVREMSPFNARGAEGIDTWETYLGPTTGYSEQNYAFDPVADGKGHTLAVLANATRDKAIALRYNRNELPCFTVWKNTQAIEDGYCTGIEPATNFPNFKTFERKQGRVRLLPPGGKWECRWVIEVADSASAVGGMLAEVATLQAQAKAVVHRTPNAKFAPV